MYYPEEVVEQVIAANDIVDVVGSYVQLKRAGSGYKGLCPFHNEKTPSFSVSPSRQTFHCFGCGEGGNVISFLMKYENDSFQEALKVLADRAGITLPEAEYSRDAQQRSAQRARLLTINKEAAIWFYRQLRLPSGRAGLTYLTERGLSAQTMKTFGLGYAGGDSCGLVQHLREKGFGDEDILTAGVAVFDEKRGLHDKFRNRVMFPIMDTTNRVIGFGGRVLGEGRPKYLNSPETPVFDKSRNLYGLNIAKKSRTGYMILCEGYMDVIAMHQAGFTQAVASLGTSFTEGQALILRRYVRQVLLAYDSDDAGIRAAIRNIGILNAAGLTGKVVKLEPFKDPDEFVKNLGAEELQKRLDQAENSFFFQIRQLAKDYSMNDPASRTQFYHELAKRLCGFSDEIERDSYIKAMASAYYIDEDMLRREVMTYAKVYGQDAPEGKDAAILAGTSFTAGTRGRLPARDRQYAAMRPSEEGGTAGQEAESSGGRNSAGYRNVRRGVDARAGSAQRAVLRNEQLLMTWLADDPGLYPQIRDYISSEDFTDGPHRMAADKYFDMLEKASGDRLAAASGAAGAVRTSPAMVIASFEDEAQQDVVSAMFETRLPGIAGQEREKALRDILCAVKRASVRRLSEDMRDASALDRLVKAKRDLRELETMPLRLKEED